jgi:hypothetical protein
MLFQVEENSLLICKQEIFVKIKYNISIVISPQVKRPDKNLFTASKILNRAHTGRKAFNEDYCITNLKLPPCEVIIKVNFDRNI